MSLLMSFLLFLSNTTIFSQGRPILASACQSHSRGGGGGIFIGGHFCVTLATCHLQHSFVEHIRWDILQFMALGAKQCFGVESVEAVIVIKT